MGYYWRGRTLLKQPRRANQRTKRNSLQNKWKSHAELYTWINWMFKFTTVGRPVPGARWIDINSRWWWFTELGIKIEPFCLEIWFWRERIKRIEWNNKKVHRGIEPGWAKRRSRLCQLSYEKMLYCEVEDVEISMPVSSCLKFAIIP